MQENNNTLDSNNGQLDLDSSFDQVILLFNQYQALIEDKHQDLKRMVELKDIENKKLAEKNQELVDSMKQVTIVPDDHVFSLHINQLKVKACELLDEAVLFRQYSEELLNRYTSTKSKYK
ncbi:hypothetical protein [Thorsellia kenyensis]|uniref:Uncharacterized protein n=1 Tax=Thorsellia kenyensis TaxID=1549888 RepID=A0ABV6C8W5_9GAMM